MAKRIQVPEFVKQSGPKIEAGTVKVYKGGKVLRLSKDILEQLAGGQSPYRFTASILKKTLILTLVVKDSQQQGTNVYLTWKSRDKSTSELVSLAGLLPLLEMTDKEAEGVFRSEVKKDEIFIHFDQKV